MSRLAEIDEREKAATKGPWIKGEYVPGGIFPENGAHVATVNQRYTLKQWRANATFIANSREDIPWLVEMVKHMKHYVFKVSIGSRSYRCKTSKNGYCGKGNCWPCQARALLAELEEEEGKGEAER